MIELCIVDEFVVVADAVAHPLLVHLAEVLAVLVEHLIIQSVLELAVVVVIRSLHLWRLVGILHVVVWL